MPTPIVRQGPGCRVHPTAVLYPNVRLGRNVTVFPGAVIGRPPLSSGATTRRVDARKLPPVLIGEDCVIGANAVVYAGVTIGARSMVCDTACVREGVRIGNRCVIAMGVTINYDTRIGDGVKVMDLTHLTGNMLVEDGAFIGPHVSTANDNAMGRKPPRGRAWKEKGPVVHRGAAVGAGAVLLPGVEIGAGATVAAGAVVTRDVPAGARAVGVPARCVSS